ncbi:MAG: gluconate 2-dehydrogenase subunit 3 family protein [Pseudomonadota bacterium]
MVPIRRKSDAATTISRREVLGRLLAGAMAVGGWSNAATAQALQAAGSLLAPGRKSLDAAQLATLGAAAAVIMPPTDTPGAVEAGVPAFIDGLYVQWMNAAEAAAFTTGLAALDAVALQQHKATFAACTTAQRSEMLQALRAASPFKGRAFSLTDRITHPEAPFFTRLRDLVVFGYFTSEAGSTQELRYIPVPGSFKGDVDIKTWSYQMVL